MVSCQPSSAQPSQKSRAEGKASAWWPSPAGCLEQGRALTAGGGGGRKRSEQLRAPWGGSPNRKAHTHCRL